MSNADHTIDYNIAEQLKKGDFYSQYAGWDFCGYVYWDKKQWICEVWVYHSVVDTIKADTLEEIMTEVSNKYGQD